MEVIIILLIASVLVAAGFLGAFLWAVRHEQYDDLETPAVRILFDNPAPNNVKEKKNASQAEN